MLWQQKYFPSSLQLSILYSYPDGAGMREQKYGNYPLHYAVHYGAPVSVVRELIVIHREAAQLKNFAGCTMHTELIFYNISIIFRSF